MRKFFISYTWYHGTEHGYGSMFAEISSSRRRVPLEQQTIEEMLRLCEAEFIKMRPDSDIIPRIILLFFHELEA